MSEKAKVGFMYLAVPINPSFNEPPFFGISERKSELILCIVVKAVIKAIIKSSEKTNFSPRLKEVSALRIESRINAILFFTR